jgi:type I restriction enzyme S subunit
MSADHPGEWVTTSLKDLFEIRYGKGLPQEKRNHKGKVNVYGSNGVVGTHDASITQGVTIIIGRKGSVGEVHLSPQKCWPIDTTYFVDEFSCGLPPSYWALYLKSLRLGQQDKSSAIPGINRDDIYGIEIPLPPLNEQRRIVAKLEKLLDKVDSCQKRLAKIPILLKRFRQAVLAAACSGRLTEDWREENHSAGSLIVEDAFGSQSDERDFPNEWHITNLGALVKLITSGSRGWAKYYAESGAIFIRAQNINSDILDLDQPTYVQLPESCEGLRTKVQLHDILITITGAKVTKSALVSESR